MATVDLTINPKKDEKTGIDVVFQVPGDGLDRKVDKGQYDECINSLAEQIVETFKFKQQT